MEQWDEEKHWVLFICVLRRREKWISEEERASQRERERERERVKWMKNWVFVVVVVYIILMDWLVIYTTVKIYVIKC